MKNVKLYNLTFGVLFALQSLILNAQEPEAKTRVVGKALIGIDDTNYVIQTDKYYYKIVKNKISKQLSKRLETAALNGQKLTITLPNRGIELVWPISFNRKNNVHPNTVLTAKKSKIKKGADHIQLNGTLMLSMAEPYYLVQVNETIYQIKKSALDKQQLNALNSVQVGSPINIELLPKAISYTWNYHTYTSRTIASIPENDSVSENASYVRINGTILYSASEPSIIVQSEDHYYQLKRNSISTQEPQLLDVHGARVKLVVPLKGIEFSW